VVQGSLLWTDVKGFSPGVLRFTHVWIRDGGAWKLAGTDGANELAPRNDAGNGRRGPRRRGSRSCFSPRR
jgi:hypothetical protein